MDAVVLEEVPAISQSVLNLRQKLPQLRQVGNVFARLVANLVPDWPELLADGRVKRLEQRVLHVEVFQVEVLMSACTLLTHQRVVPLELDDHGLHALENSLLDLCHGRSERLIQFDDVGFAGSKGVLDQLVESTSARQRQTHLGQKWTLRMLRFIKVSLSGLIPKANASGSSENALVNPVCHQQSLSAPT